MIKIYGVKNTIKRIRKESAKAVRLQQKRETVKLVRGLKQSTPVDTGKARAGWKIEGRRIINRVSYLTYLNKGSSKQAPSNFIESAVLSHRGVIPNGTIVDNV